MRLEEKSRRARLVTGYLQGSLGKKGKVSPGFFSGNAEEGGEQTWAGESVKASGEK